MIPDTTVKKVAMTRSTWPATVMAGRAAGTKVPMYCIRKMAMMATIWETVFRLHQLLAALTRFCSHAKRRKEVKAHYRRGGLGDVKVKKFLIAVLNETLEPIRERRKQYEGRIEEVYEILRKGSEHARATAAQTLGEVRHAMRIDYFDDKELIAEQARQYQQQR